MQDLSSTLYTGIKAQSQWGIWAQVPSYFPADGAVHITQGNHLMGLDKKLGGSYGRDPAL